MSDGATEMLRETLEAAERCTTEERRDATQWRCPACGARDDEPHQPQCTAVLGFGPRVLARSAKVSSALAQQEGGDHYKSMAIQPIEYIHKNGIGFAEGCVIKYVSRWRAKGGVEDLRKARHFLDLLIEMEGV